MDKFKNMKIEKESPLPLYYQVQLYIEEEIKNGKWKISSQIPSEKELCENLGVSRITIRKSIDSLISKGFLKRNKGGRAVVSNDIEKESLRDIFFSFYNYLKKKGLTVKIKVINLEKILPDNLIKNVLGLSENEKVVRIDRLKIVHNEPWYYETTYFPERYYNISKEDLTIDSTIEIIEKNMSIKVKKTRLYIYAGIANEENRRLLGVDIGSPMQIFEAINYIDESKAIEYSINYIKGEKILFDFELTEDEITNFMDKR